MNREQRRAAQRQARKNSGDLNTCWDDLNAIYGQCRDLLSRHTHISNLANNIAIRPFIVDPSGVASNLNILTRDITNLGAQLAQINSKHRGRVGGSQNPDVIVETIQIYEEYAGFMDTHENVVMPTVKWLLDAFSQAEIGYQKSLSIINAAGVPAAPIQVMAKVIPAEEAGQEIPMAIPVASESQSTSDQ